MRRRKDKGMPKRKRLWTSLIPRFHEIQRGMISECHAQSSEGFERAGIAEIVRQGLLICRDGLVATALAFQGQTQGVPCQHPVPGIASSWTAIP